MDRQDLQREPGKPPKDASLKPTEDKAPEEEEEEEEKPLPKAALKEPKPGNTSPEGDGGGGGPQQPEVKPPNKRPPAAGSPEPSPKKAKTTGSNGVNNSVPATSAQDSSQAEEKPEVKAEQAKPESEPEAPKKPPEPVEESSPKEEASLKAEDVKPAPSGPSSSSSDSGSKPSQSHSQGALLFGKPRRFPTAAEFSFRIDWSKDFGKSKDGSQSSTKKLNPMEPGGPPTKLWHSKEDDKKGSLPKMSEKPEARCIPIATKISFHAAQDKDLGKSKDGNQSSTKKFDSLEPGKPPARLWSSEGDAKKASLPKKSEEPKAREIPSAVKFSFRVDWDKDFGDSKDGGQSSTKKLNSMEPGEVPAELQNSEEGDGAKENLLKMSKEPEARHIPTEAECSFQTGQDRDLNRSKDGGQSGTKKLDSMEPDEALAELQNSEGDGEKESLPKTNKEPEARHIPTEAECSFQDRDFIRSKDGSQSSTKNLGSVEPGDAPAELQNSEGDGKKESLPKMCKEPEATVWENLYKTPNEYIPCSRKKRDRSYSFGLLNGFPHDIEKYMAKKPPDLGDSCVNFSKFGKCQYGVACRFAGAHLGENYQNMVNEELWKKWEGRSVVRNKLKNRGSAERILKNFPFTKSSEYIFCLNKAANAASATNTGTSAPSLLTLKTVGVLTDEDLIRLRPCEKRKLDLQGKLYLSPLSGCGSLPFRRICKRFGADITCSEMVPCVLSTDQIPSALEFLHRHETEDLFGIQLQETTPRKMVKYADLLNGMSQVDFVEINAEHAKKINYFKGGGAYEISLMSHPHSFESIVRGLDYVMDVPVTVKLNTGRNNAHRLAHTLIPKLRDWGVSMVTLHGRSSEGLYQNLADWEYIGGCAKLSAPMPLFGNGDIYSFEDATRAMEMGVSGITIARAALVKPWIFTEIKERRHWDISARERLDMLKDFTDFGLEYWGSDTMGVEKTRHYLLNWLSFLCRYIPVGLLEHLPPKMAHQHPGVLYGDYLENLMSSEMIKDWVTISEMFLGTVPDYYHFEPINNVDGFLRRL